MTDGVSKETAHSAADESKTDKNSISWAVFRTSVVLSKEQSSRCLRVRCIVFRFTGLLTWCNTSHKDTHESTASIETSSTTSQSLAHGENGKTESHKANPLQSSQSTFPRKESVHTIRGDILDQLRNKLLGTSNRMY